MSRLTTRNSNGTVGVKSPIRYYNYQDIEEILEKLAHYEDLEEQGRLIELPCAVGDPIFEVIEDKKIVVHSFQRYWRIARYVEEKVFGNIAFTSKEEAEAKLAELKGTEE